jgi:hypothetical protein
MIGDYVLSSNTTLLVTEYRVMVASAAPQSQDGSIEGTSASNDRLLAGYPVSVSGMITVPVGSMYQTVVANIQQLQTQSDGTTVQVISRL